MGADVAAAARILRRTHRVEAEWPLRQHRVPSLIPQAARDAALPLRQYVSLLTRHLQRIGVAPLPRERVAVVLTPGTRLTGALALALREASGVAPYFIVRAQRPGESVRVIKPGALLDVLDPPNKAGPPRSAF